MKKITLLLFGMLIGNYAYAEKQHSIGTSTSPTVDFAIPECAVVLAPANGATDVVINTDINNLVTLNWTAPLFGETVSSYKIYFGQHADAMFFVGMTSDFTFSVDGIFPSTTYYWQAIPVGADGDAAGCEVWNFTTETTAPLTPDYINNFSVTEDGWYRAIGPLDGQVTKVNANDWETFDFGNQSDGPNGFAAYINLYNQGVPSYNWIVSPRIDLSAPPLYLNYEIALTSFRDPSAAVFTGEEFVALLASEDDGLTWTELDRWDENSDIDFNGEQAPQRTLTQTGNTRFAFYSFISANSVSNIDFFVDNFKITQNLSIIKQERATFVFYPNPVIDVLSLSSSELMLEVAIYNLMGQRVLNKKMNDLESIIDMSGLPSGNYIARITSENAVKSIKLIKR